MHLTAEEIIKTVEPTDAEHEKWAAELMRPRRMRLRPFKDRGKTPVLNASNPLPELHTLTDDEVEVLQQWFPDYRPGDSILDELEATLLHDLKRSVTELPELTLPQVIGLLRRAESASPMMTTDETKRSMTVFYSWQSDLPNHLNRAFIGSALGQAAQQLSTTAGIQPRVDQDTRGLPGSPDVFNAILEKIRGADAFVCDVSLIGSVQKKDGTTERGTVNPNVLVELGYALAVLGPERIIMVFNEAFGTTRELPFDLGFKRQVVYHAEGEKGLDRSADKKALAGDLKVKLEAVSSAVRHDHMIKRIWDLLGGYQRSFDFVREKLGCEYTDEFLEDLLRRCSDYFVRANIKGGKRGLRRAPNASPEGPGRLIKLA